VKQSARDKLERARMRDAAAVAQLHRELDVKLTPREAEVLRLYASGLRRREAADVLGVKASTIIMHLKRARWALGAKTVTEAVVLAKQRGLI
jgi:DNA-binding CsgD family transcriptional regulator